jgi:transposase-like protein
MALSSAPRCPLCGAEMREELGMERRNEGLVQRWWTCPKCLHRSVTTEDTGEGEDGIQHPEHPGE